MEIENEKEQAKQVEDEYDTTKNACYFIFIIYIQKVSLEKVTETTNNLRTLLLLKNYLNTKILTDKKH